MQLVDAFVLTLELDPRQFTDGQRKYAEALRKMEIESEGAGKRIEASGLKITDVFAVAKAGALGLLGAFVGHEITDAVRHIADLDNQLGKVAITSGVPAQNFSAWEGAVMQLGGAAGSATSAISTLQNEINAVTAGGSHFSDWAQTWFSKIGDPRGMPADEVLMRLARQVDVELAHGARRDQIATSLRAIPGLNEDTLNLIIRGSKALHQALDEAKKTVPSDADIKNAAEFTKEMNLLTRALDNLTRVSHVMPVLTAFMDGMAKIFEYLGGVVDQAKLKARTDAVVYGKRNPGDVFDETTNTWRPPGGGGGLAGTTHRMPALHEFLWAVMKLIPAGIVDIPALREFLWAADRSRAGIAADRSPVWGPNDQYGGAFMPDWMGSLDFAQPAGRWTRPTEEPGLVAPWDGGEYSVHPTVQRGGPRGNMPIVAPNGWRSSEITNRAGNVQTSSMTIQNLTVVTQATDAQGIANDIGAHLRRVAKATPANYGLV